jgi:transcriptional regulator with XRE-family HTH domain
MVKKINIKIPDSTRALLENIANQLVMAREAQGYSREDISEALKIHINLITALERGAFEDLPGASSFFASLRSYSRFLKLDSEQIILECKKNRFLFESLQGQGLIQRGDQEKSKVNQASRNEEYPRAKQETHVYRVEPSKPLANVTEEQGTELAVKPKKRVYLKGKNIILSLFVLMLFAFAGGSVYLIANSKAMDSIDLPAFLDNVKSNLSFGNKSCETFKMVAIEAVDIRVTALSLSVPIIDQTLFPNEEIKFSDKKGVEIEVSDHNQAEVYYGDKLLSWSKMKKIGEETYVYKCN